MTILQEGLHTAEFLLSEGNGEISREVIEIDASAGDLVPGTVLGQLTSGGKYVDYDNAANDGSQTAKGILYAFVPDSASAQKAVMIARYAEVDEDKLTGIDSVGKADLAALGIICR